MRTPFVIATVAGFCLCLATTFSPARAADPAASMKLAVVDLQRAVAETEDGLRAQANLRKFFDRRQQELTAKQEDLVKRKDDLDRQSKVLSKEALQRSIEDWQKQMAELQAVYVDYNKEFQKRQTEATGPIFNRLTGIVRKVAQRDGYDLILDRQVVPYSRTDLDLTDHVILMYNAGEAPAADPEPSSAPNSASPTLPPVSPASPARKSP